MQKLKPVEQQFNKNNRPYNTKAIFSHPFCPEFWRCAAGEFKNWRMLVFAAVIIAMRIAVKAVKIVIIPGALNFGFDFIVNSAGSMIYGPLVGLLVGAVSDTIGAVLFPTGAYFFPFIFAEMLSSFIFGLFLYRAKLSSWRVIASRFAVVVVCNFIVNPLVMTLYNAVTGADPYKFITIARVIKNAAMFPLESVVLVIWLGAISMALYKLHLLPEKPPMIKVSVGNIVALVCAAVISALAIFGYVKWKKSNTKPKPESTPAPITETAAPTGDVPNTP